MMFNNNNNNNGAGINQGTGMMTAGIGGGGGGVPPMNALQGYGGMGNPMMGGLPTIRMDGATQQQQQMFFQQQQQQQLQAQQQQAQQQQQALAREQQDLLKAQYEELQRLKMGAAEKQTVPEAEAENKGGMPGARPGKAGEPPLRAAEEGERKSSGSGGGSNQKQTFFHDAMRRDFEFADEDFGEFTKFQIEARAHHVQQFRAWQKNKNALFGGGSGASIVGGTPVGSSAGTPREDVKPVGFSQEQLDDAVKKARMEERNDALLQQQQHQQQQQQRQAHLQPGGLKDTFSKVGEAAMSMRLGGLDENEAPQQSQQRQPMQSSSSGGVFIPPPPSGKPRGAMSDDEIRAQIILGDEFDERWSRIRKQVEDERRSSGLAAGGLASGSASITPGPKPGSQLALPPGGGRNAHAWQQQQYSHNGREDERFGSPSLQGTLGTGAEGR